VSANLLVRAARFYVSLGWPVLPLHTWTGTACSCGRRDCPSPGKHPRTAHGLKDATVEPEKIDAAWARWPDANLGLVTGVAFDVVDIDGPAGLDELNRVRAGRATPWGPEAVTGKGWHLYHRPTGQGNRAGVVAGVDYRGVGGYVVAPPSVHHTGRRYTWCADAGPAEPLEPLPGWLAELVTPAAPAVTVPATSHATPTPYGQVALDAELGRVALASEGQRNDQLNRSAHALGQLVAGGVLDATLAVDRLLEAAARAGLGATESERTIASGMRAGMTHPRRTR
jgi:hypothetical protein